MSKERLLELCEKLERRIGDVALLVGEAEATQMITDVRDALSQLEAAELEAECKAAALSGVQSMRDSLRTQLEAAKADTARLDWLDKQDPEHIALGDNGFKWAVGAGPFWESDDLRECIDGCMQDEAEERARASRSHKGE